MASIVFTDGATVLTFTLNPSFPRKASTAAPILITGRSGRGTVHVENKGVLVELALTWPEHCPMSAANYWSGTPNLISFFRQVRGMQDAWTFTDHDSTTHEAQFMDVPELSHVSKGFAGTVTLGLRT